MGFLPCWSSQKGKRLCWPIPIGEKPDNAGWPGFQMVSENGVKDNYLLLFRKLHSNEAVKKIRLKFLAGKSIKITNLKTGATMIKRADAAGNVGFDIKNPADFLFLKYDVMAD